VDKWLADISPVMDVEHDCILSTQGDITVVYEAALPEIFTRSADELEALHQAWIKAIRLLPKDSVLHQQDWFISNSYHASGNFDKASFLNRSAASHFKGRSYLEHRCFVMITKKAVGRKSATSILSTLIRPRLVPEQTLNPLALQELEDKAGQFEKILRDAGVWLKRMQTEQIKSRQNFTGLIEQYLTLSGKSDSREVFDLELRDGLRIGDKYCQLFTLADIDSLPEICSSAIGYDQYSTDKTKFPVGFATAIGLLLPCNHLYSQFIMVGDAQATLKKFESKRLRLQSLSTYSRENAIARDSVNDFLNECIGQSRLPVKAHFNILAWTEDKQEIKEVKNIVAAALAQMNAATKIETAGAAQIFWAGIPGNAGDFPVNDTFDTFAEQASCFLNLATNYSSVKPDQGIRFCDRLNGRPVYVDLFDAPRKEGITSNMGMLVCGTSGGGKSMTVNHILRSLFDQGAHCVTVDIGGSYKGLCELVGGYYFTYEERNPICFNPFFIPPGEVLDTEKKESLKALLVSLWKQENENFNRSEYVALSNALAGYYEQLSKAKNLFPCFNSFYEYLESQYVELLKTQRVKDRDFDIDNFLYVLRPYYKGGEFDYLLNASINLDLLNQQFIVFELDNIKDHPILFPVVTLIIMEMFISKMRKLAGVRKVLTIDEAWKAIAKSGMAEFLKYAFKTIRKFNGIPCVITQELDDLVSSPIIKDAIINNADIKILMDMRKYLNKFDKLQETLGLSDKAKTILLSVNKDDREIFIDLGGIVTKVYRNELSPEEYYAYTTEGKERVRVQEYASRFGSMEKGISRLVNDLKKGNQQDMHSG